MTSTARNLPALWTCLRSVADAIRSGESDTSAAVLAAMADLESCLATFGIDTARGDARRSRGDASHLGDVFTLAAAYCDLAVERLPLHDRVQAFFAVLPSSGCNLYRTLYLLAAFGLDLNPDDAMAHDFPRQWEDELEVFDRDRIGEIFERVAAQVPDVCGLMIAVGADLRGYHDRHRAVSCPTEAEARMLISSRDLAAADSLVAIPFEPMRTGPGAGRFIIVDFETRAAFTLADLDRCRGVVNPTV